MRSPGSTVVVVVGGVTDAIVRELGRLPNVQALRLTDEESRATAEAAARPAVGAPSVREVLASAHSPFLVHDLDPLAAVARAWTAFFENPATLPALRIETESALASFAAGESVLPDYYLVLGPETITTAESQWWLGVLAAVAPSRVLPVEATTGAVQRMLGSLPTGRAWPEPAGWLRELPLQVPDRVGLF